MTRHEKVRAYQLRLEQCGEDGAWSIDVRADDVLDDGELHLWHDTMEVPDDMLIRSISDRLLEYWLGSGNVALMDLWPKLP